MEVATGAASTFSLHSRILSPSLSTRTLNRNRTVKASLTSNFPSPSAANINDAGEFAGATLRSSLLYPASFSRSKPKRSVIANICIPFTPGHTRGDPPDLASYFINERIVYMGLPVVPEVVKMIVCEFMFLNMESKKKPIYFYINSTGIIYKDRMVADHTDAIAILDIMQVTKAPIYTLCMGNAWGEAAMFLAAGGRGQRAALPSSTIMIREPIDRFQGQATMVENKRKYLSSMRGILVETLAKQTQKSVEQIEADIRHPKYFSPSEAVEYGLIDKVLYDEKTFRKKKGESDVKKEAKKKAPQ